MANGLIRQQDNSGSLIKLTKKNAEENVNKVEDIFANSMEGKTGYENNDDPNMKEEAKMAQDQDDESSSLR